MMITNFITSLCMIAGMSVQPSIVSTQDSDIEAKIEKQLSSMTLEEKIGQMIELEVNVITRPNSCQVDAEKLDSTINTYKIGSILNAPMTTAQTPVVWNEVVKTIQDASLKGLGIPTIYGLDQTHGTTYTAGGTLFPNAINMAATFNRDLARKMGEIVAYETRACNVPWIYGPSIDLGRHQAWSRQYESFGEDAFLNGEMGAAIVQGMQGPDPNHIDKYHVASTLKHYFAYGTPNNGLDRTPGIVSPQQLREKQFAPFLRCFREGALSIMTNSATVNYMKGLTNHRYLTEWLKRDLDWDGMIVTDWGDVEGLVHNDYITPSRKEAIRMAVNAGVDMMMVPQQYTYNKLLKELVEEGKVSMNRIDDAVRRILRLKFRLNLFEQPNTLKEDYPKFGSEEFATYSRQAALESIVLLKNDSIEETARRLLPIPQNSKILVTGPNAHSMRTLNGGWSYSWQGNAANREDFTGRYNTIYEALQHRFGAENVTLVEGVSYTNDFWTLEDATHIDEAIKATADVDYIVVCIGENSYAETTGNIPDLNLSENQKQLVKALAQTGKPIVMVLNEGRARIIRDIEPLAQAVVNVMLPGNYGGDALADLLAGDENFSGRLPYTYCTYPNALVNYDYKINEKNTLVKDGVQAYAQWWFGEGLSYTTYEYSRLRVDKEEFTKDDVLTVSVDVKNTGHRTGKETVLLYSSDLYASLVPDNKRLRAFEKIELQPGECRTVVFRIPASELAFVNFDEKWTLEEGDFHLSCGPLVLPIHCTETYVWDTPNRL